MTSEMESSQDNSEMSSSGAGNNKGKDEEKFRSDDVYDE